MTGTRCGFVDRDHGRRVVVGVLGRFKSHEAALSALHNGMSPFDDGVPSEPDNVFPTIKSIVIP